MQNRQFGFLGSEKESMMLEAHYVAWLWSESACEFLRSGSRNKCRSIWPILGKCKIPKIRTLLQKIKQALTVHIPIGLRGSE